jgi:hypothetical protein
MKRGIIILGIVAVIIVITLLSREKEIEVFSFDNQSKITLDYDLAYDLSTTEGFKAKTSFALDDFDLFLNEYVLKSDMYFKTITGYFDGQPVTYYYLQEDGYFYYIYQTNSGAVLKTVYTRYEGFEIEFYFPFINDFHSFNDLGEIKYLWDEMDWFDEFEDLVTFYSYMDDDLYIIDEVEKTISLRAVDVNNDLVYSQGYPIVLHITEQGIEVEYIESEL